jgi:flagellar biosynthesis/type III secretory pathway protein FliH
VLRFEYKAIQLNRLNWRDFVRRENPVAAALMAKMDIAKEDRPRVKLECLRLLATLKLDRARMNFISAFVDTYLKLSPTEEAKFETELAELVPQEKEGVMELTTSWMERGIEKGLQQGLQQGEAAVTLRLLKRRFGVLPEAVTTRISALPLDRIEALADALLDFATPDDLTRWLDQTE